jgi:hypothetical protein
MVAKATIRVRTSGDVAGQRPGRAQLERAAKLLQESGFEVLRVGRFGVNVQGDEQAFKRELGVSVQGTKNLVEAPTPHHQELAQLIDLVEVADRPLNFGKF